MKTNFVRYKKTLLFIMCLAFAIIKYNITTLADTIIPSSEFEDNNFYQYVIENFDTNGDGLLEQSEAEAAIIIDISYESSELSEAAYAYASIKGIEYFSNIKYLDISGCKNITDFTSLLQMTALERLDVSETNIHDISVLVNMKNLKELYLAYCGNITDFSVILTLTDLEVLNLCNLKNFKDISLLRNLKNLNFLILAGVDIVDFSMLSTFENIRTLNIENTSVKDINFLKNMSSLQDLILLNCEYIEDFSVLTELTNLKMLYVSNNNTFSSYVQNLSTLKNMEFFKIGYNIEELPDMTDWTNLQYVYFADNKITEEEALAKLPAHITSQENWRETTGLIYQRNNEDETSSNPQENETMGNTDEGRIITSVSDNSISAEGTFESDIYLEAKRIEDTSAYDNIIKEIHNSLTDIIDTSIYDIWLYKKEIHEGEDVRIKVQPNGSVKIMIEIEEVEGVKYHVFRQEDDNALTKLNCYIEDRTLIFYSEHFSIFSVVISRLLDDEENETESNPHKSDKGNYINIQQQGIKFPLLYEAESNGEEMTKPLNEIKNEENHNNESNSTLWENEPKAADKPADTVNNNKLNKQIDTGNSEQGNNIEGIAGIAIVGTVGAGLFGYDIMKRKRGDYMRNFQIDEPRPEASNNK